VGAAAFVETPAPTPAPGPESRPMEGKKPPGWFYYVPSRFGRCPKAREIHTLAECHEAAVALGFFSRWRGGSEGKATINVHHVPVGCWTRHAGHRCWSDNSCELSLNMASWGVNNGNYMAICKNEDATWPLLEPGELKYPKGWFFKVEDGDCPMNSDILSHIECKEAVIKLGLWHTWREDDSGKAKAGQVPRGCWTQSAGNGETSVDDATVSSNKGAYTAICKVPVGGYSGDAEPWKNIRYAMLGYNLYEGDPLPILDASTKLGPNGTTIMDPGLKLPLFMEQYTDGRFSADMRHTNPDGYHATVDQGCSTIFTTKTIKDEYQYKTDQSKTVSLSARVEAAIKFPPAPGKSKEPSQKPSVGVSGKAFARAGGTLSHQWRDMQSGNNLRDQQMYRTSAKCSSYVAAYNYARPPPTHPTFKKRVGSLGDAASYFLLFDDFGTHFLTSIRMGARYGSSMFVDKSSASAMEKTANGLGVTVDLSVGAVAKLGVGYKSASLGVKKVAKLEAKIPLLTPKEKIAAETFKGRFVKKSTASVVGAALPKEGVAAWSYEVNQNPVPIQWDNEVICMHPEIIKDDLKYRACVAHMNNYCTQHLKAKGASCSPAAEKECYSDLDCNPSTDFQCQEWKCVPVPKCRVTLYKDRNKGGLSYKVPPVTVLTHVDGMYFNLKSMQGWHDQISSFDMSSGCERIEMADDDGNCGLGASDNGRFLSSRNSLGEDLDNDVCVIKVWAKPVPQAGWMDLTGKQASQCQDRYANTASRAIDGVSEAKWNWHSCTETTWTNQPWWEVDLGQEYDIQAVRVTNRADCCEDRLNGFEVYTFSGGKYSLCAEDQWAGRGQTVTIACVAKTSKVRIKLPRYGMLTLCEVGVYSQPGETPRRLLAPATANLQSRRGVSNATDIQLGAAPVDDAQAESGLSQENIDSQTETVDEPEAVQGRLLGAASEGGYVKNIGKAMYGYNHFFGAPASSMSAGTDPGFVHRPVWKASYGKGANAVTQVFSEIPREAGLYDEFTRRSGWLAGCGTSNFGIADGKASCAGRKDCVGLTCRVDGCQLCTSSRLTPSTVGAISYLKRTPPRRLAAGNMNSSLYVYGPERRLTAPTTDEGLLRIPDGWQVTLAAQTICDKDFHTEQMQTDYDYEKLTTKNLNPMGFKLDLGQYSFSMSHEKRDFQKSNSKYKKKMYQTTAECLEYIAEIADLANNPPPTDESFEFVTKAAIEEKDFYAVFDMYGLHFPSKLYFGAKYGFTQMIDSSSWSTLKSTSSSFSVGAEVTKGIKMKKDIGPVGLSATVGASYGSKSSREESAKFDSHFSETKEFSLGRRMPNEGGVEEWVKQIGGEPMPIRYGLVSLCEHPAFAKKKSDCVQYSKSYCEKHLVHSGQDVRCDAAEKRECTWDMDCLPRHTCTDDGKCEELPSCTVELFEHEYFNGGKTTMGPVYYTDAAGGPNGGKVIKYTKSLIGSARVSKGCDKVVLVDEDNCKVSHRDNLVLGHSVDSLEHKDFWGDLENDICEVSVLARKDWNE